MPELPEVETIKRGLEVQIAGRKIKDVFTSNKKLRIDYPENLQESLIGHKIKSVKRRSKYLLIYLDNSKILTIHLGMSGKISFQDSNEVAEPIKKHDHFILTFDDDFKMIFNDARRFGLVTVISEDEIEIHKLFKDLGAEPFSEEFSGKYLKEKFKGKTVPIKQALMDAKNLVGVGNIYASEALFRARITPFKKAGEVKIKELNLLAENVQQVLSEAIESGGSTLRDYVRSDGDIGYFQHKFNVYGRENQPCLICNTKVKRIVQQGRSSFYCPACQK